MQGFLGNEILGVGINTYIGVWSILTWTHYMGLKSMKRNCKHTGYLWTSDETQYIFIQINTK